METKRILVADDDGEILKLIEKKLKDNNYDCLTTNQAKDVVGLSKTYMPHLILLDIAMPEIDGYAACNLLKKDKLTKGIPVLFLTGKDLDPQSILERCQDLSVIGYISKLSSLTELLEKVKEVIG